MPKKSFRNLQHVTGLVRLPHINYVSIYKLPSTVFIMSDMLIIMYITVINVSLLISRRDGREDNILLVIDLPFPRLIPKKEPNVHPEETYGQS